MENIGKREHMESMNVKTWLFFFFFFDLEKRRLSHTRTKKKKKRQTDPDFFLTLRQTNIFFMPNVEYGKTKCGDT